MPPDELSKFFGASNWHQTKAKRKLIDRFEDKLRGDRNVDILIDNNTKEVFLRGNKSKIIINTGERLK